MRKLLLIAFLAAQFSMIVGLASAEPPMCPACVVAR